MGRGCPGDGDGTARKEGAGSGAVADAPDSSRHCALTTITAPPHFAWRALSLCPPALLVLPFK